MSTEFRKLKNTVIQQLAEQDVDITSLMSHPDVEEIVFSQKVGNKLEKIEIKMFPDGRHHIICGLNNGLHVRRSFADYDVRVVGMKEVLNHFHCTIINLYNTKEQIENLRAEQAKLIERYDEIQQNIFRLESLTRDQ